MLELGVFVLSYRPEVRRFLHVCLHLSELSPVVIEVCPVSHEIHFTIEIHHEVIKFSHVLSELFRFPLKLHLPVLQPSLLSQLNLLIVLLQLFTTLGHSLRQQIKEPLNLFKRLRLMFLHSFLELNSLFDLSCMSLEDLRKTLLHLDAFVLQLFVCT